VRAAERFDVNGAVVALAAGVATNTDAAAKGFRLLPDAFSSPFFRTFALDSGIVL